MGIYSEYLSKAMGFPEITAERKEMLRRISRLRGDRDVLVYASDLTKNAQTQIEYSDLMPFQDQLANLAGDSIDIILETPGGFAEVVEDMVRLLRARYKDVGVIVPGYAKSAGTIFAMAADEILMGQLSALGPIDAQIMSNNKRFSAEAFLEGLNKIKEEVTASGRLNAAYIPILQNISPGEIQHCENAQDFSKSLVADWLTRFKFAQWKTHSSTGSSVTEAEKKARAAEIAEKLCKHSDWLTHGRSIKLADLDTMRLKITDYSADSALNDAITRYYTLLRMGFESTNLYKLFETINAQIYRFSIPPGTQPPQNPAGEIAEIQFQCPSCNNRLQIQANLNKHADLQQGNHEYPVDTDVFKCPNCSTETNIAAIKLQIEAQSGKKVVK